MAEVQPTIEKVNGFKVAGVHSGLKKDGNLDFALIVSDTPCVAAGVFTTNQVKAAPVLVDMERLKHHAHHIRAVAINTGSANACSGQQGIDNALQTARWVAEEIGCSEDEVLVMSTGVIGTQLPMDKIKRGVQLASDSLGDNWEAAARAIMTTDTKPKMAFLKDEQGRYQMGGISKGAGMIAPNMATLLGVMVTDAVLTTVQAKRSLYEVVNLSFNHIVVDGDMSTNDTVLLLANGRAAFSLDSLGDEARFIQHLQKPATKLAKDIVLDGEGVTKFITLIVDGLPDDETALKVANTVATSPLVKTAFYGEDANWGRIIAAAGRAGTPLNPENLRLWINAGEALDDPTELLLFDYGVPTSYIETYALEIMQSSSITVYLECGMGSGRALIWTCDLSHDYVSINGDYRT